MSGGGNRTPSLHEDTQATIDGAAQLGLCLVLRGDEPLAGSERWPLAQLDEVVLGRAERSAVALVGRQLRIAVNDPYISTSHARLLRCVNGWAIEDLGSKNGTLLNGTPCARAMLSDGDAIALGTASFMFATSVDRRDLGPLATLTPQVREVHDKLAKVAESNLPVVLLGETGVGKEVAARAIHDLSHRKGSYVAVNCGALPATLLEATLFGHRRGAFTGAHDHQPGVVYSAHQGTLFLDEVGELSPAAQVALLRVLQESEVVPVGGTEARRVNVRVVAATNRDLAADIAGGRFREDLYARLAGLAVRLPPLRDRRADLGLLVRAILLRVAPAPGEVRITARAARALLEHAWPQNVRELEMCLRQAGAFAGWHKIDLYHLPDATRHTAAPLVERDRLEGLLRSHRGNVSEVARELGTSRTQVHRMLRRCAIEPGPFRECPR